MFLPGKEKSFMRLHEKRLCNNLFWGTFLKYVTCVHSFYSCVLNRVTRKRTEWGII